MFGLKARSLGRREGRTAPSPCVESLENRRLLSADLGGAFVGHVPAILLPASKQPIIIRLTNHGDAPAAGPVTVSLYASQDGSLNGGDALLGQVARNMKLKPGKSVNLKVRANPAATLSKGTYQLLARIDDSALTGSTKAGGTQIAAPNAVQVQQPSVDLSAMITEIPLQPIGLGGNSQHAVVSVKNLGNAPAKGKLAVSWFLSTDTTLDAGDTMIAAPAPVSINLGAGKTHAFATDVALPANVPVGTYYVLARVNAGGGIADTNPGNDVAVGSSPIMVVNVVQERDQRGRITKIHRQEIVTSGVGSSILACGGTIYIGYDDQGDVVDTSDFGDVYFPPDGSQPPDDGSNDFGPPMDNSPPPESDPGPAPDPGGGMNDGGGMDNGGGDFSSTGSDF